MRRPRLTRDSEGKPRRRLLVGSKGNPLVGAVALLEVVAARGVHVGSHGGVLLSEGYLVNNTVRLLCCSLRDPRTRSADWRSGGTGVAVACRQRVWPEPLC